MVLILVYTVYTVLGFVYGFCFTVLGFDSCFTHYCLCTHLKRIQLDVFSKCAQLLASATDKVATADKA
eukprot:SAG22_NODE_14722_length_366_cov_5.235955_1_plen_67_part_01